MNTNLLKAAISKRGLTAYIVAERLGLNSATFSRKALGKSDFTVSEIQGLIKILDLTEGDMLDIFFR